MLADTSENKLKKRICVGILAHVDAGKTTLAEGLLFLAGEIRKLGRVDHKDAFLDTFSMERERGITIFSKQAVFTSGDMEVTLLDTPGHVDFSSEMERTLQVLDYAVLVVSGTDGVQSHTEVLWDLLTRYRIPTFIFVNKMDMEGTDGEKILQELKSRLSDNIVNFTSLPEFEGTDRKAGEIGLLQDSKEQWLDNLAMCHECLLNAYMESGHIPTDMVREQIIARHIFPCFFGSALRMQGVEEFLKGLEYYTEQPYYPEEFGAKVFKIAREDNVRLTYMKITGGSLKVKTMISGRVPRNETAGVGTGDGNSKDSGVWQEKADQLRIYNGAKYTSVQEAKAGMICAVTGLNRTYAGQNLGAEYSCMEQILEPVLTYRLIFPEEIEPHMMLRKLYQLEEEEPQLRIIWDEQLQEIHIHVMGEVQIDVVKNQIKQRFGVDVEFGEGSIVYKETITAPAYGVGHFEPLRHYAEVHLLLEPGEPGSGVSIAASCSEDILAKNWQRLVLTHLAERQHIGVLTGSPITDIKITLVTGRAHLKHTEGGDFRQATYRAVRQGLKNARCRLLEPYYDFRLEVPTDNVGRAMTDIDAMSGKVSAPELVGDMSVLKGKAPVSAMRGYAASLSAYTKGRGRISCTLAGYDVCHNEEEVIRQKNYDSEADLRNPSGSIFCAHGSGYVVEWDKVYDYMHMERVVDIDENGEITRKQSTYLADGIDYSKAVNASAKAKDLYADESELEAIFERTYGPVKRKNPGGSQVLGAERTPNGKDERKTGEKNPGDPKYEKKKTNIKPREKYLLVDGYNIIFAWQDLRELSEIDLGAARTKLMDILCNYQGFTGCHLILVFDAYKVKGNHGEISRYHNIHVVYTKEAETADMYIEKVTHEIARNHDVTVATSDGLEQVIILGAGAMRLSADGLQQEIARMEEQIREFL